MALPKRIFVTGTNTDIGKTVVSGVLVAGLNAHYWKPIQTGLIDGTDTDWIRQHTDIPEDQISPEIYSLQQPLSPHAAAALEEVQIDLEAFSLPEIPADESLIVEGAGGLLVPLNEQHYMLDLISRLAIPVLLVSDSQLGTINHTLLSIRQLRENDIPVAGVVMNGPKNPGNKESIEFYGKVAVLAEIEPLEEISHTTLERCFQDAFN
ncbi:MAG TPA: dethiobiotin synthase [Gammaproteobacteria bacterium]|nr:dethiobiotin synthase [Gammaproteobacteria bacterium]|tara:strand:+ start:738 stop:1361 length:624 start_codon:yes stop_codon:yes gene_type:complete